MYKKLANEFSGVLAGKGQGWGGSLIRPEATGHGTIYFVEEMLQVNDDSIYQEICLVSGSGNVAQYAVENINRIGGRADVVAFLDPADELDRAMALFG